MGGSSGGSHSGGHEKKTAEEIFNLRRKKALVLERKASQKKEKTKGRGGSALFYCSDIWGGPSGCGCERRRDEGAADATDHLTGAGMGAG